ncbi:hypothetical protein GVY41_02000 [Frigidibacter albus]|uniref:Porin n=1 Tax=Frigidibacter albus TaxID=1465486 RepID=A0A6L8VC17_9RHOB|nr:hypothetical protein [Frigidibacter albus]MZQ87868.1 hypothetical protein [Frigidibacter albus]NBE29774.1 hypothetical protein [Frigidibacter albus]GGH42836.1 hypothetical protein GCM10011341_01070 [Frigidibacter albus]
MQPETSRRQRMRSLALGLAIGMAAALPAAALTPLQEGVYARGGVEVEHLRFGDEDATGAYLDFDIGIATGTVFGLPVGVELGAEGFSEADGESAFYGAATFDTGLGVVGVGVPRFALDKYVSTPKLGGFRLIEVIDLGLIDGRGVSGLYYLTSSDIPYGISYDLAGENFGLGLSYHEYDDEDGTSVIQAAGNVRAGLMVFGAGGEYLDSRAGDAEFYTASIALQTEWFDLGAQHSRLQTTIDFGELITDDFGEALDELGVGSLAVTGEVDATKLWATWRPIQRLDLTASYVAFDGGNEELYGLNARYNLAGMFVEGGAVDGFGNEPLYSASVGFDF